MKTASFRITILSFVVLFLIPVGPAYSIPAFARKYQISCQVCHSPAMPRLKSFGEEFATKGFRLKEYESPRYFIPTGDDRLSLFRELPLAFRLDGYVLFDFEKNKSPKFASPYILKILSGGELSEKISYYFYFLLTEGGEIVGVEDAFLMYRDLFKTGINFYIGQFQASDPLFKSELRYTLQGYEIYDSKPGNSAASLKYERGIMLEKPFSSGTTILAEVLNGCGIDAPLFDNDKYKSYMFRLSQAIGKKITIGGFAYFGKEGLQDTLNAFNNSVRMFGPDIKINFADKFVLNAQYVYRTDSHVFDSGEGKTYENVLTRGGFVELIYSPKGDMSKWYLTGLFNWVDSDADVLDFTAGTLHAGYLLRRNFRVVGEYTYRFTGTKYGTLNFGFVSAF